jgi:hypothetical protein
MTRQDRLLGGHITASAIGPLRLPSRDALVAGLTRIAATGPDARVGLTFGNGDTWDFDEARLAALCESIVQVVPAFEAETATASLNRLADEMDLDRPLTILIAGDYLVQLFEHRIGDGAIMLGLPAALIAVANGEDVPDWLAGTSSAHPLRDALMTTFAAHPRRALDLVKARGAAIAVDPESVEEAWAPAYSIEFALGSPEANSAIRAWTKQHDAPVSFTSAVTVMLRRALEASGIVLSNRVTAILDARRYLPDGAATTGNFITGIPLAVSDPDDPRLVEAALQSTVATARPLAALAAGLAKHAAGEREAALPDTAPVNPRAHVVMSNMGVSRPLENLPWRDGTGIGRSLFSNRPIGPQDISVLMMMIGGNIHLTATFHGNIFSPEKVAMALELVANRPHELFDRRVPTA